MSPTEVFGLALLACSVIAIVKERPILALIFLSSAVSFAP
jgi:hypothetical protein